MTTSFGLRSPSFLISQIVYLTLMDSQPTPPPSLAWTAALSLPPWRFLCAAAGGLGREPGVGGREPLCSMTASQRMYYHNGSAVDEDYIVQRAPTRRHTNTHLRRTLTPRLRPIRCIHCPPPALLQISTDKSNFFYHRAVWYGNFGIRLHRYHVFLSSINPDTRRVALSAQRPCLMCADWCLRSVVMPNSCSVGPT